MLAIALYSEGIIRGRELVILNVKVCRENLLPTQKKANLPFSRGQKDHQHICKYDGGHALQSPS